MALAAGEREAAFADSGAWIRRLERIVGAVAMDAACGFALAVSERGRMHALAVGGDGIAMAGQTARLVAGVAFAYRRSVTRMRGMAVGTVQSGVHGSGERARIHTGRRATRRGGSRDD